VSVESDPPKEDIFPPSLVEKKLNSKVLLLETEFPLFLMPSSLPESVLGSFSIYDFDPRLPKKFAPRAGKAELEENGENLAIVLRNIMANSDEKRKFFNLVKYLLPFVDDVSVERALDKSLLLRIRETFSKEFLPSFLISDGTINMIALVLALYFGKKPITIIEEPERNIHPHLISKVVHMMEDASQSKLSNQIIVTTHNPEMVKHADPKNLLLISRNREGFSSISRPHDKEKVKIFLENEIGIEDLYVDSLLEI
jgi:predicted ATPase